MPDSWKRLELRAADVEGPLSWRWVLADEATGISLAEHRVRLDRTSWEAEAFTDPSRYLAWRADADRRVAEEAELVRRLGEWIARDVLGAEIVEALAAARPALVRVVDASFLLSAPLELATVDGTPLARHDRLRLVFATGGPDGVETPVEGAARMLAVFSQPAGTTALATRAERTALERTVARLRRPVDLTVLQWGVTRETLAARLAEGGGPDVLYLSGHGTQGAVLLERPDGSPDEVDGAVLAGLLRDAGAAPRLVVLSACESAAVLLAETLEMLGLPAAAPPNAGTGAAPAVGWALARELGCTVLAMRYPVTDDFATALTSSFYAGLLEDGLDAGAALGRAMRASAGTVSAARPALSLAAPVLIGPAGTVLGPADVVAAPHETVPDVAEMADLPHGAEHFVGRGRQLAAADTVLAEGDGPVAVLFTGMTGVGKTACAVEAAQTHRALFRAAVFWTATEHGDALARLATALDEGVPGGLGLTEALSAPKRWRAALAHLEEVLARERVLIVLDGLDAPTSGIRPPDPRWAELLAPFAAHGGRSRLVATGRTVPAGLTGPDVLEVPVHPLSRDEAALLARQLPRLRALLHIDDGPEADPADAAADRARARAVLAASQGHPQLLMLADAEAGEAPDGSDFPDSGESTLDEAALAGVLTDWTARALLRLTPDALLLMRFLAGMEPHHRFRSVLSQCWDGLWERPGRPGGPPPPDDIVRELCSAGLVAERAPDGLDLRTPATAVRYEIQPTVARAVRDTTPAEVAAEIDLLMGDRMERFASLMSAGGSREKTAVVVTFHLGAVPYLLRREEQARAADNLDQALARDDSPGTWQRALPLVRALDPALPERPLLEGRALARIDRDEAERLLRQGLELPDEMLAAAAARSLFNVLFRQGRLDEAREMADRSARIADRVGPWTSLALRLDPLRILHESHRDEEVLAGLAPLLEEARSLPDDTGSREFVTPWSVREVLLNTASTAAQALERWQEALDYGRELLASVQRRGAGELDLALHWFNFHAPLAGLGRFPEAIRALEYCQDVAEETGDDRLLSKVRGAQAFLATRRGRPAEAAELERAALRLGYLEPETTNLLTGHGMLGNHLGKLGTDPAGQLAHHLAQALLGKLIGSARQPKALHMVATDLHTYGEVRLPEDVAALTERVERVEGVRFAALLGTLLDDDVRADDVYAELLAEVRATAAEQGFDVAGYLPRHEWLLPTIAAAADGDAAAQARLPDASPPGTGALAIATHRLLGGERDAERLLDGLHPADAAVIRRLLAELDWRATIGAARTAAERRDVLGADLAAAVDAADHVRAGRRAAELSDELREGGDLQGALEYAEQAAAHDERAGWGPWTRQADQVRRLRLLSVLDRGDEVVATIAALRAEWTDPLPEPTHADPVDSAGVRAELARLAQLAVLRGAYPPSGRASTTAIILGHGECVRISLDARDADRIVVHHLASAVVCRLVGDPAEEELARADVRALRALNGPPPPRTLHELAARLEGEMGVPFGWLVTRAIGTPQRAEQVYADLVREASAGR